MFYTQIIIGKHWRKQGSIANVFCDLIQYCFSRSRASLQQRLALNEARRKNIDKQLFEMQQSTVS